MGKACPECRDLAARVAEVEGVLEELSLRLSAVERFPLIGPYVVVGNREALAARRRRETTAAPAKIG